MTLEQRLASALRDRYRIERELGGGMTATVYLADDVKLGRRVALKVLRTELGLAVGAERFLREIRTAAKLSHPGILPLLDSGEADGYLYFTMPFVEGESLRQRLDRGGRMPVDEALRLIDDVASALAYAHERGVVHRDVKPENILLEHESPLLADFGIALALGESEAERLTQAGIAIGTPQYMSPEQAGGDVGIDHRSDVYSLACVLYEMLAGEPPFSGPTTQSVVMQQLCDPPPPLRTLRPEVPSPVALSIEQALAKDPADRFQSVRAFADALFDPSQRRHRRRRHPHRRRYLIAGVAAAAAVLIGALLAVRAPSRATLRERDWVLVSDFDGPRSDPGLANAVRELVTTALNQSRFFTTMPRQQLAGALRTAGLPDTMSVNVDLARELAFRSAVRAVIGGRIDSVAGGFSLELRAVDAANGHALATIGARASPDSLIPVVQRLAHTMRERLGEQRHDLEANQVLLDIATPSLPAYRMYVDAIARKQRGDVSGSTRLLHDALALDTGFASAWALIGLNYVEARNLDSARLAFSEALRRPDRLSTAQRFRLLADAAYAVDHDLPSAIRWYDKYIELMPRSIGGPNNRGLYLSMLGRYEDALADFERAESNDPFAPGQAQVAIVNAADMLMSLGRLDRATAKARELTGVYEQYARIRLMTVSGRWVAADSLAAQILAASTSPSALRLEATTTHAAALAARGAAAEADRVLASAASAASGPHRRWYEGARSLLALTSAPGRLDRGTLTSPDSAPGALVARGIRLALLGDTVAARDAVRRLAAAPDDQRRRLAHGALVIDALLDRAAHRWDRVVRALADTARAGEHDATDLDHVPSVMLRWLVAEAYAQLGRLDSATYFMNAAISAERIPPGHRSLRGFAYPYGKRMLARWHAQRGQADSARAEWKAFTETFTSPDTRLRALLADSSWLRS